MDNMINFELAEKLYKDETFKSTVPVTKANEKYLEYPPLSELIRALGTKEFYLAREDEDGEWICRYDDSDDCMIDCCGSEGKGDTPEEAVANLWLEINNNK